MAITPITNTLTRNSNVAFTALKVKKDKQEQESCSSSSFMKAVPLATMLAMSPLTVANINAADRIDEGHNIELVEAQGIDEVEQNQRKIVASKVFPYPIGDYLTVKANLVNNTGGNGFDKVELVYTDSKNISRDDGDVNVYVKGIDTYNLTVISDDGVDQGTISYSVIKTKTPGIMGEFSMIHSDLSNYLFEKLENNPKRDKIPVNVYNRRIAPSIGGAFQNNAKTVNINNVKGLTIDKSDYLKAASSRVVQGDHDTYTLRFYKSRSTGNRLVTCEKSTNPGNEFRVAMAGNFTARFGRDDYSKVVASYKLTNLRNDNNSYGIMDTALTEELQKIRASELGKNAYICPQADYDYEVLGKGVLANITE